MIKNIFTMLAILAIANVAKGQVWIEDSVSLQPSYANDVYYSLKNGVQREENSKNWHIGFSLSIADSAAVWANHSGGARVYDINKTYSQWSSVSLNDTSTGTLIYNNDQYWSNGAFNDITSANPFDYGWGVYNLDSHNVYGTKVFLVKANNEFYKFYIQKLVALPMEWYFEYAKFDSLGVAGTSILDTLKKQNGYQDNLFAYYNLTTGTDTNREAPAPTWDIHFIRYTTDAPGSGPLVNNNVVGALMNRGALATRVQQIPADTVFQNAYTYTPNLSPIISTIGYNWKTPPPPTWTILDSNSYLIKEKNGGIYLLEFLNFGGNTTGKIYFRKAIVEPTSIKDVNSKVSSFSFYPMPASNELNLVLDAKVSHQSTLSLVDLSGKKIVTQILNVQAGFNAFKLPTSQFANGNYIVNIQGDGINISQQVSISK